jgi:hypothetical protein
MDHVRFTRVVSRGATAQACPAWQTDCPPGQGGRPLLLCRLVWLCAKMCELSELCELSHRDTLFFTKMIKMIKQLI